MVDRQKRGMGRWMNPKLNCENVASELWNSAPCEACGNAKSIFICNHTSIWPATHQGKTGIILFQEMENGGVSGELIPEDFDPGHIGTQLIMVLPGRDALKSIRLALDDVEEMLGWNGEMKEGGQADPDQTP